MYQLYVSYILFPDIVIHTFCEINAFFFSLILFDLHAQELCDPCFSFGIFKLSFKPLG